VLETGSRDQRASNPAVSGAIIEEREVSWRVVLASQRRIGPRNWAW
jgi:hypothetical protein